MGLHIFLFSAKPLVDRIGYFHSLRLALLRLAAIFPRTFQVKAASVPISAKQKPSEGEPFFIQRSLFGKVETLAKRIEYELQRGEWNHCAVYEDELKRLWPLGAKDREAKIAVRREEIALYAYYIWQTEGRPKGRALEHWLQAELQLRTARVLDAPRPQI